MDMDEIKVIKETWGYFVEPGKKPKRKKFLPTLKNLDRDLDGQPESLRIRLTTGKPVVVFDSMDSALKGKDYNFTIAVMPEEKKTWIDISGEAIIFGRDDDDNLIDLELTDAELKELVSWPYD